MDWSSEAVGIKDSLPGVRSVETDFFSGRVSVENLSCFLFFSLCFPLCSAIRVSLEGEHYLPPSTQRHTPPPLFFSF